MLKDKINSILYDINYAIGNLKAWFWIICNDRDWDWGYLYDIIIFKMRRMARVLVDRKGGKEYSSLIRCIKILETLKKLDQCECKKKKPCGKRSMFVECENRKGKLLKEFGELFATYSQYWWN
jgi:hypothetical protein